MDAVDVTGRTKRTTWSNATSVMRGGTSVVPALRDQLPIVRGCAPAVNAPPALPPEPVSRVDRLRN